MRLTKRMRGELVRLGSGDRRSYGQYAFGWTTTQKALVRRGLAETFEAFSARRDRMPRIRITDAGLDMLLATARSAA